MSAQNETPINATELKAQLRAKCVHVEDEMFSSWEQDPLKVAAADYIEKLERQLSAPGAGLTDVVSNMLNIYNVTFTDDTSRKVAVNSWVQQLQQAALRAPQAAPSAQAERGWAINQPETSTDSPCIESDGCPTELAVLQRFWRKHHTITEDGR